MERRGGLHSLLCDFLLSSSDAFIGVEFDVLTLEG